MSETPPLPSVSGTERIVVRPRPGGRAAPAGTPVSPAPTTADPGAADPGHDAPVTGTGMLPAAMPLLQLMARLRTMANPPDAALLRTRIDAGLAQFEQRAMKAGAAADQVRRAHYALCVSLDAMVMNTPWGASGVWASRSLTAEHHAAVPASRFVDVLRQAESKGAVSVPLVELMHACLSLGQPTPEDQAEPVRIQAYEFLRQHVPAPAAELSSGWRGVAAPFVARRTLIPFWVVASAGLALVAGVYLLVFNRVNDASDDVLTAMLAAPPAQMPQIARDVAVVPPAPAPPNEAGPNLRDRLRDRLRTAGVAPAQASAVGTPDTPILRIEARELFGPGSAVLSPAAARLLARIGEVLHDQRGSVAIIGYTDSQPFRSVQFPSNVELSAARARAVLAGMPGDIAGWSAEGRGAAAPVASNATPEGREQNRRIDIVFRRAA